MASPGEIWARKFSTLLDRYRRPDGKRWRGVDFDRETNGYVNGSYVTALSKGRIEEPGLNKLRRISEAMGFPFQEWFSPLEDEPRADPKELGFSGEDTIAARLNYLFEAIPNDKTGRPFTDQEVARYSLGRLSEEDVRGLRTGEAYDPSRDILLALCDVFDVDFSYWDERADQLQLLSPDTLRALRDKESLAILHKSHALPEEDKSLIITVLEELERRRTSGGGSHVGDAGTPG
jgi:transcriptional regulator with XRE-family HTH domain